MIAAVTGLIAGMVHVWSGPDHLAAIAPLAVRRPQRPWLPGVRWGVGHSAGVAAVGLLSLWLRDALPVEWLSSWGERLVGVLLVGIGLWGMRRAFQNKIHTHEHEHDGNRHVHVHVHAHKVSQEHSRAAHRHTHAAFGVGILHGLAGSSHFLGVLPVLAFPTMTQAVGYLLAFGAGTVLSMAFFSSAVGLVAHRCSIGGDRAYRNLMSICSVGAMSVGCFWLVTSFR
jgi:ABC-type nickel/cobalt efflux system permease component RcnA